MDAGGAGEVATSSAFPSAPNVAVNQHSSARFAWGGIRNSPSNEGWQGAIDAGYVFDYALSDAEMDSIYENGMQT